MRQIAHQVVLGFNLEFQFFVIYMKRQKRRLDEKVKSSDSFEVQLTDKNYDPCDLVVTSVNPMLIGIHVIEFGARIATR